MEALANLEAIKSILEALKNLEAKKVFSYGDHDCFRIPVVCFDLVLVIGNLVILWAENNGLFTDFANRPIRN